MVAEDLEQEEGLLVAIFKYGIHYGILDRVMKMKNFGKGCKRHGGRGARKLLQFIGNHRQTKIFHYFAVGLIE